MAIHMRASSFASGIPLAWRALTEHKLRAALTVLGVVMGTGTIIGVGSILSGFDGAVSGIMSSFGTDKLVVFKFKVGFRVADLARHGGELPQLREAAEWLIERSPEAVDTLIARWIGAGVRFAEA